MAKSEKRISARVLRKKGWGIRSIATELGVSRASVSVWCSDIALTEKQKDTLMRRAERGVRRGQLNGAATNQKKKEDTIARHRAEAYRDFHVLTRREIFLAGLGVYWGEGIKGKGTVAISNSDPGLVLFMLEWFRLVFGVPREMFRPQVFINESHRSRERVIMQFWSRLLEMPYNQFRKVVFIKVKNKKVYENHNSYYGVLALRVRRGTDLKYKILGYIDALGAHPKRPT